MRTHLLKIPAEREIPEGIDPGPAANDSQPSVVSAAPNLTQINTAPAVNDNDDYCLGGYAGI
jgi:hypothetical protein